MTWQRADIWKSLPGRDPEIFWVFCIAYRNSTVIFLTRFWTLWSNLRWQIRALELANIVRKRRWQWPSFKNARIWVWLLCCFSHLGPLYRLYRNIVLQFCFCLEKPININLQSVKHLRTPFIWNINNNGHIYLLFSPGTTPDVFTEQAAFSHCHTRINLIHLFNRPNYL